MLSKEFLVFNEEVLVLLAFSIFVFLLVNYGGDMIASELDSRKQRIKEEFDLYKDLQEKTFVHLIGYHEKQRLLNSEIRTIFEISKSEIASIEKYYENLLENHISSNIEELLRRISTNESKISSALQKKIFVDLRSHLMVAYSVENGRMSKKNRKLSIKACVEQLKVCH